MSPAVTVRLRRAVWPTSTSAPALGGLLDPGQGLRHAVFELGLPVAQYEAFGERAQRRGLERLERLGGRRRFRPGEAVRPAGRRLVAVELREAELLRPLCDHHARHGRLAGEPSA